MIDNIVSPKNNPKRKIAGLLGFFWGIFLVLLAFPGAASATAPINLNDEAAMFSYADLGPVDFSPKSLSVEVYVAQAPELAAFNRMEAQVWEKVEQFYARMGVILRFRQGGAAPGSLAPAERLRVEVLTDKEWLARSFKAFDVAPPFRLRFLKVCRDKFAFAHLPLSTIHISFKRFEDAEFSTKRREAPLNRSWMANLLIHELGHLMGLYHSHEFKNDPIPEYIGPHRIPNFMGHDIAYKTELGFVEFQKRLVHSYLGKGKVFQQYQYVDFDPLRYLELVKKYNGYQEGPKEGKEGKPEAAAPMKKIKSVALASEEEGEEDEN